MKETTAIKAAAILKEMEQAKAAREVLSKVAEVQLRNPQCTVASVQTMNPAVYFHNSSSLVLPKELEEQFTSETIRYLSRILRHLDYHIHNLKTGLDDLNDFRPGIRNKDEEEVTDEK